MLMVVYPIKIPCFQKPNFYSRPAVRSVRSQLNLPTVLPHLLRSVQHSTYLHFVLKSVSTPKVRRQERQLNALESKMCVDDD
jgi:hypothetical protein